MGGDRRRRRSTMAFFGNILVSVKARGRLGRIDAYNTGKPPTPGSCSSSTGLLRSGGASPCTGTADSAFGSAVAARWVLSALEAPSWRLPKQRPWSLEGDRGDGGPHF